MKRPLLSAVCVLFCALPLLAAEPKMLFEERFAAKPGEGWTWLRENPPAWRIADGGLEIRVEPGAAGNVKNALLRKLPDRSKGQFAAEVTVTFKTPPTNQFEQAGFTFYHGGKNGFKLVHEQIDGKTYIIPGKIATTTKTVQLRIVYSADKYTAQFRARRQRRLPNRRHRRPSRPRRRPPRHPLLPRPGRRRALDAV